MLESFRHYFFNSFGRRPCSLLRDLWFLIISMSSQWMSSLKWVFSFSLHVTHDEVAECWYISLVLVSHSFHKASIGSALLAKEINWKSSHFMVCRELTEVHIVLRELCRVLINRLLNLTSSDEWFMLRSSSLCFILPAIEFVGVLSQCALHSFE